MHVDLCCPPLPPPKWDNLWDFFILITIDSHVGVLYHSLSMWIHKYLICSQLLKTRRCRDPKAKGIHWSLRRPCWCHWVQSVLSCVWEREAGSKHPISSYWGVAFSNLYANIAFAASKQMDDIIYFPSVSLSRDLQSSVDRSRKPRKVTY